MLICLPSDKRVDVHVDSATEIIVFISGCEESCRVPEHCDSEPIFGNNLVSIKKSDMVFLRRFVSTKEPPKEKKLHD